MREKTAIVEKYIKPKKKGKHTPPKLRFHWNQLIIEGIAENITIDFDHFAPDGTPLRAKVSLSIKEQDHEYQFLKKGPGVKKKDTPGSDQETDVESSALALAEETPPEFAARMGLDPAAWRGLVAEGISSGIALEAGTEVGFNTSLAVHTGIGFHVGVEANVDVSLEASFGLEANASISAGFSASAGASVDANLAAGFALSAAGGVGAALNAVKKVKGGLASDTAREAFDLLPAGVTTADAPQQPARPEQPRTPLMADGSRPATQQVSPLRPPSAIDVDSRAITYGFGVPLRPRVSGAAEERKGLIEGRGPLRSPSRDDQGLFREDPTEAPWIRLPKRDEGRGRADKIQKDRRRKPCGCIHPCKHSGGF